MIRGCLAIAWVQFDMGGFQSIWFRVLVHPSYEGAWGLRYQRARGCMLPGAGNVSGVNYTISIDERHAAPTMVAIAIKRIARTRAPVSLQQEINRRESSK